MQDDVTVKKKNLSGHGQKKNLSIISSDNAFGKWKACGLWPPSTEPTRLFVKGTGSQNLCQYIHYKK